jgi:subtilase family serine protease
MLRLNDPEHGAIGVWGSTGLSQVCHPANTAFFDHELVRYPLDESAGRFGDATLSGKIAAGTYMAKRYALLCDPEAWIALPTKPDLTLYPSDILLKPTEPGASQLVRILPTLRNQGVAIGADSTAWVRVTVESPSGDSTMVGEMDTPCVWHLAWTPETPINWYTTAETGPHVVRVRVDSHGEIPESREDNNVAELVVDVLHEAPIVSWPQDCALLGSGQVSLVVHAVSLPPGVTEFEYLFEVAAADTFVPGMYDYQTSGWLGSGGIVTTWEPPGLVMGETYFWHCRVRADNGDLGAWTETVSFTLRTDEGTWIQTEEGQYEKNDGDDVDIASSPGDAILGSQVSNTDYARIEQGASVTVSSYWEGHTNPDHLIGGGDPEGDFYFAPGDQDEWAVVSWPAPLMLSHVGSRQEAGTMDYAVWSHYRVSTSVDSVTWIEWLELGPFAYPALENIPSIVYANTLPPTQVRHLKIEFGQCAQNGNGSRVMEIFARVVHFTPDGWLRSVDIGPAAAWDSLWWHSDEPLSTQFGITVSGWNVGSGQWDELLEDLTAPVTLSGIDPALYPRLQLQADLATADSLETPALEEWAVGFEGIADLLLDPADVSYDSVPSPGAETPIRFAVRNVGLVQVDSVAIGLYEQLGDSLVDLGIGITLYDLLPGGVPRWAELGWTAEEGVHTIRVTADPADAVEEGDETNNTVAVVFRVLPDLALQSLTWAPSGVVEGDTLAVSAQVGNEGVVVCPTWFVRFTAGGGQDTMWGDVVPGPSSLDPGEESVVQSAWAAVPAGTWLVTATADPESLIAEISETNNVRSETLLVLTMTDLVIGEGDVRLSNPMPPEGDPVTLTGVVRNYGEQPADSVRVAFWEGSPGAEGSVLIGESGPVPVPGMDSTFFEVEWPTMGQAGEDTLWAVADPDSVVRESREDNNAYWVPVTVSPRPDLLVQGDSLGFAPGSPVVGESLSVLLVVRNSGAAPAGDVVVRLCEGVPGQTGPPLAPDITVPSLGGLESREVRFVFVPEEAGDLDVTAVLDPADQVEESNEANNLCWGRVSIAALPDLSVAREDVRLDPSSPVEGQTVLVEARIRNVGEGGAGAFAVDLWNGDPQAGALIDTARVDTLAGGGQTDLAWVWATVGQGGTRQLWIVADSREAVDETEESNNRVSVAVEIIPDTTAPLLVLDRKGFVAGDYLEPGDTLLVRGSDDGSGLDTTSLSVAWNGDTVSPEPNWALPGDVCVALPVPETVGTNTYTVRIADLAGNADTLDVLYRIGGVLRVVEVLPYPNPAPGRTAFVLGTTRSGAVTVEVYTLAGSLVKRVRAQMSGTRASVPWDGTDEDGDAVANGVYLYRVIVDSGDERATRLGRLVMRR